MKDFSSFDKRFRVFPSLHGDPQVGDFSILIVCGQVSGFAVLPHVLTSPACIGEAMACLILFSFLLFDFSPHTSPTRICQPRRGPFLARLFVCFFLIALFFFSLSLFVFETAGYKINWER